MSLQKNKIKLIKSSIISNSKGNVVKLWSIKKFPKKSIKEIYFTNIKKNMIKGWKMHTKADLILFVISGKVKFFYKSKNESFCKTEVISSNKICGLVIPKNNWFAFKGIYKNQSIVMSCSSIIHNPKESVTKNFNYKNLKIRGLK